MNEKFVDEMITEAVIRLEALRLAIDSSTPEKTAEEIVTRAKVFESFLKGE